MQTTIKQFEVHQSVVDSIKEHAKREDAKGRYEAVGFVARLRNASVATATLPLNNHAPNPTQAYFVEPWEQFRAERKLADQRYVIVGTYHSHPNGEALPSATDHQLARPGEAVFIYSVVFDQLAVYHQEDGYLIPGELVYAE